MGYQLWWFQLWNYQITATLFLSLHVVCGVFLTSASYSIPLSLPKSLLSILILNWSRCCWTSSRQEVKHKGLCICVCVCVWMLVSEISLSVQELSSQHKHNLLSNFLSCLNPNSYHVWLYMNVRPTASLCPFLCFAFASPRCSCVSTVKIKFLCSLFGLCIFSWRSVGVVLYERLLLLVMKWDKYINWVSCVPNTHSS